MRLQNEPVTNIEVTEPPTGYQAAIDISRRPTHSAAALHFTRITWTLPK